MSETIRGFRACAIRESTQTGIGIIEHTRDNSRTLAIHSLYFPTRLSNRDTYVNTVEHIMAHVNPEDKIILKVSKMVDKREWKTRPQVKSSGKKYTPFFFEEPLLLAEDAVGRGTTICEVLNDGT